MPTKFTFYHIKMQLTLEFEPIHPKWIERINEMLISVNEGRKKNDVYKPLLQLQVSPDVILFAAENENRERVFNALTLSGEVPPDFCANWRNMEFIIHDLKTILSP